MPCAAAAAGGAQTRPYHCRRRRSADRISVVQFSSCWASRAQKKRAEESWRSRAPERGNPTMPARQRALSQAPGAREVHQAAAGGRRRLAAGAGRWAANRGGAAAAGRRRAGSAQPCCPASHTSCLSCSPLSLALGSASAAARAWCAARRVLRRRRRVRPAGHAGRRRRHAPRLLLVFAADYRWRRQLCHTGRAAGLAGGPAAAHAPPASAGVALLRPRRRRTAGCAAGWGGAPGLPGSAATQRSCAPGSGLGLHCCTVPPPTAPPPPHMQAATAAPPRPPRSKWLR